MCIRFFCCKIVNILLLFLLINMDIALFLSKYDELFFLSKLWHNYVMGQMGEWLNNNRSIHILQNDHVSLKNDLKIGLIK